MGARIEFSNAKSILEEVSRHSTRECRTRGIYAGGRHLHGLLERHAGDGASEHRQLGLLALGTLSVRLALELGEVVEAENLSAALQPRSVDELELEVLLPEALRRLAVAEPAHHQRARPVHVVALLQLPGGGVRPQPRHVRVQLQRVRQRLRSPNTTPRVNGCARSEALWSVVSVLVGRLGRCDDKSPPGVVTYRGVNDRKNRTFYC
eukprot:1155525-Prorocentrum_minimum.AAC.2